MNIKILTESQGVRVPLILFSLLLVWFATTYSYYPGLAISFEGDVNGLVQGRVKWDFGHGFNELDGIDVQVSAATEEHQTDNLGAVTIEPSGLKSEKSYGYSIWLIVDKEDLENESFILTGDYEWGSWLNYRNSRQGRKLNLLPGAKIVFPSQKNTFDVYIFKTVSAGIARVTADRGDTAFYDGYGLNRFGGSEKNVFGQRSSGEIVSIIDPFRGKYLEYLPLPRQEIKGIKFDSRVSQSIRAIHPAHSLTVRLQESLGQGTPPLAIEKMLINGRVIDWQDEKLSISNLSEDKQGILAAGDFCLNYQGSIVSWEMVLKGNISTDVLTIKVDGKEAVVHKIFNEKKNISIFSGSTIIERASLSLRKILIKDVRGEVLTQSVAGVDGDEHLLSLQILAQAVQKKFHWGLFALQALAAGVLASLYYWLSKLAMFREFGAIREWPALLFYRHERWFFWLIFLVGLSMNVAFLLAEWPGSLTPDSIHVNREVKWLQFTNHHPYIYEWLILGMYQIYDSPVTVIIGQMVCFHLLSGLFFYCLLREGVRLYILLPLFLLPLFSVPINLFNITLWKDIPYCTLMMFWAFFLTWLAFRKFYRHQLPALATRDAVLLSALFFLLCSLRHNGIVYVPVIPLLLCCLLWGAKRWLMTFISFSTVLLLLYYFILPPFAVHYKQGQSDFAKNVIERKSGRLGTINDNKQSYYLEDYLAERTRVFFASLGTSSVADTWYTDTHQSPERWFGVDEMRADMSYNSKNKWLSNELRKILKSTTAFTGFTSGRFVFWNSLFALCGLILVFVLYKWLPLSAFYSGFFLYQAALMFFVVWPRWRYLYFIYLGGIYLLGIVVLDITCRKALGRNNRNC